MNTISNRFLRLAVVFALCGMTWGIVMGARQDFSPASAHAHLNLLGWVSMTLYGLVYRVVPKAAEGKLPHVHFWFALIGVLIFVPSLGMILAGPKDLIPKAEIGIFLASFLVWISMALFATIIFRSTSSKAVLA
jgi:cbb3-type cytochrome oxidase subunit 1